MGHARAILGLDDASAQRKLAQTVMKQGLSVRETERAVRRIVEGPGPKAATKRALVSQDANVKAAENKLRRRFSSKVQILANSQGTGGKIEIEYYDTNDLDRIYRLMMGSNQD